MESPHDISQETQSTPSPQSPQPQDTAYSPNHVNENESFQFETAISANHSNPTPSILSLNGLLQKPSLIKSEEQRNGNGNENENTDHTNTNTHHVTNTGALPPQFSGFPSSPYPHPHHHSHSHPFPQPPTISVRYPHNLYTGGTLPQFPPPPNCNPSNENKSCLMHYQPVMFPAMIPLNSNNRGIPLNIHHPPPLITNTPNNVINEDDIFGAKYSPITTPTHTQTQHTKQIMIINQNKLNHPLNVATNTKTKKRKRKRGKKRKRKHNNESNEEESNNAYDTNDSNDSNDEDDEEYYYNEEEEEEEEEEEGEDINVEEGISNLRTRPISKKRKISNDNDNDNDNDNYDNDNASANGRHFCTYCDKSFVQNCHLSRHIREKHASSKPSFECRICSKSFNQRSNLKVHLRSHALDESVSRPWLCTECYPNRRFTRKSSLKRHWVKKHKTISAQLISELDLSISNQANASGSTAIKNENIKNEPVPSLRYEHGIYRIGDIEIPPEVFQPTTQPPHSNNLPPLVGN